MTLKKCQIQEADVSDHCVVYLKVKIKEQEKSMLWRLNIGILKENNEEEIKKDITMYVKEQ